MLPFLLFVHKTLFCLIPLLEQFSQFCPTKKDFHFIIIIAAHQSIFNCKSNQVVDLLPVFFNRHGAQFLPFDFLNGFPTITIRLNVKIGIHGLIIALAYYAIFVDGCF